jgi:hypothetical protein
MTATATVQPDQDMTEVIIHFDKVKRLTATEWEITDPYIKYERVELLFNGIWLIGHK